MTAIEFNNISKQYRLGLVSTKTLSHDLNRWYQMNIRGKEDPYLKIGSINDRASAADSDYVWALKNIDFKIEQGDVVGIIGKNGAGKSTLLKILSRVTSPTTGTIRAKGRIASLLEVGTGFHPEMTGRENIFMNGAIMGMTKREIKSKLDEIVDFSGCERYIDTPTKRYSSGMTVRLGFAIAAFLEPEILVVDEVLAVGDAEFQKKAIGKMQDVSKGDGRTVLFVSHNMASMQQLCNNGILLENGQTIFSGTISQTITKYLSSKALHKKDLIGRFDSSPLPKAYITNVVFTDLNGDKTETVLCASKANIEVFYRSELSSKITINIGIYNSMSDKLLHLSTEYIGENILNPPAEGKFVFSFDKFPLPEGSYYLNITLWSNNHRYDWLTDSITMDVVSGDFYNSGRIPPAKENKILIDYNWNLQQI